MEEDKIYTYDRLSQFVNNYTEFVNGNKVDPSSSSTPNYNYYHFETSPDAVNSDSMGRFGSSLFTDVNSPWKAMGGSNGINAWKLNLGKKMIALKNTHNANVRGNLTPGLSYTIKKFNNYSEITDITKLNVQPYDLLAQVAYVDTVSTISEFKSDSKCPSGYAANVAGEAQCFTPYSSILDEPITDNSELTATVYTPSSVNTNNIVSIEWKGYFYQETNGIYTFTAKIPDNCLYYIWFGDKSVCEFTSANADIHNKQKTFIVQIENKQPVPIRIQCIFIDKIQPVVDLTIARTQMTSENVSEEPIRLVDSLYYSSVKPFVFYAAFVSSSQADFLENIFTCYSLVTDNDGTLTKNNSDLSDFYKKFRQNLPDVINLKYDYNASNRLSYGVIPSIKTQYTISSDTSSLPFAYSIYRLHTDPRMGNTYQINTAMNEQTLYPLQKFGDDSTIITFSNDFTTKTNYYPNSSLLTDGNVVSEDGLACKKKCIDEPSCNHYYTFTSNNEPKCITRLSQPEFNRVIPQNTNVPIDPNSSSLYMRNFQINAAAGSCTDFETSNIIPVNSTSDYSEYSNYTLDAGPTITQPDQVGICGSDDYKKQKNDAYDILFKPSTYSNGGKSWTESFTGEKTTQAIEDTSDAIQTNLKNEQIYANKMESINTKEKELSQNLIPQYRETREIMENNQIYDYKGDTLLHFRNKPIPQLREKHVTDNNEQYVTSQLMLSLGTLSAATLIVFAIMLARE